MLKFKIVLAGPKDVGKSSLISRFCDDVFSEKMQTTIGVSFKRKKINVIEFDLLIDSQIWDFGGEEKYRLLFPAYAHGASAALMLYDTTDKQSLKKLKDWAQIIDDNTDDKLVKFIIGAKIDLKDQREVSIEEAKKISDEFKCYGDPVETSSKTGENVEYAFLQVARGIISTHLQRCPACNEMFSKKLKICNYCGTNIALEIITL